MCGGWSRCSEFRPRPCSDLTQCRLPAPHAGPHGTVRPGQVRSGFGQEGDGLTGSCLPSPTNRPAHSCPRSWAGCCRGWGANCNRLDFPHPHSPHPSTGGAAEGRRREGRRMSAPAGSGLSFWPRTRWRAASFPPSPAGETKHMNATRRDPTRPGRPRAKTRAAAGTAPGFGAPPSPGSRSLRPALGAAFGLSRKCHVPVSLSTYTRHTCTHMCTHTDTPYAREHTPYVHTHAHTRHTCTRAIRTHHTRERTHTHTSCAHILHTRLRLQRQIHVCTLNVCTCLCERAHASTYKDLILYNGMISFYNFLKSGPDCSPGQHRKRGARFLGQTKAERRSPDLGWKRLPPLEFCFLCNTCFLSGDRFLPDIYILNLAFHEAKRY